ncbi:MAG: Gfo/Idh/MocA family oxidoreductase [Clostridiales bacterium]|nr:Gfo/Idh/MocA family oxidoreductase [Clostridiales bacterium]
MLKLLQVGCGNISNAWLSALIKRSDVDICGLVDINKESAKKKAYEYSLECPVFTDVTEAISSMNPDIAVDNIVPASRLELAEICMSNGLHIFSEKPLGDSIESAVKIIDLSDRYAKEFFVMQNRRYNTGIFSYKNAIQTGLSGDVGYLSAEFFRDPHFGGFRDKMPSPLLVDMAIHTFDQARFLLGKEPVSVTCKEYNPAWSWYKGNASAVCIFTFEDGTVFNYSGSWCAPGMKTSWDSNWRAGGSIGTCNWNGTDFPTAQISESNSENRHPIDTDVEVQKIECLLNGHEGCINEMVESIKTGRRAQTDCRDNIKSLAMVFAAIKSSVENREVQIKELLEG